MGGIAIGATSDGHGRLTSRRRNGVLVDPVVVILSAHFSVLCDPLLPCLPTDNGPAHGTGDHGAESDENGGRQYQIRAEGHVRYEEQHIDQECQEAEQKVEDAHEEDCEQISRRVRRRMEVRYQGKDQVDQGEECCNGMHDEDGGQGGPGRGR